MILVTGAAGKTGLAVIRAAAQKGAVVRGFIHQEASRKSVLKAGAAEVLFGDLLNEKDLEDALDGVKAVYHIPPNVHPREVEIGEIAITKSVQVGIEHFVYHSVLHPQIEAMPHHWLKLRVEERLIVSGLDFTILQPTAYMQNITSQLKKILKTGIFQVPYPVDTRLCLVDIEDIAEVAAAVLTDYSHNGAVYQLVGTGLISQIEIATQLSKLLEREIQAQQISLEDWKVDVEKTGLGSYQVSTLVKMFLHYQAHGFSGNPRILHWLLGRQPTTLENCLKREISRLDAG
ncbi:MAG: NAD-dependent epimerase/dehydratase family protein [Anaerolineales bacterium]|nr:MAG: NAD-dependent epimerase/dehydratase family protein [Anaerolineales bacterium]